MKLMSMLLSLFIIFVFAVVLVLFVFRNMSQHFDSSTCNSIAITVSTGI